MLNRLKSMIESYEPYVETCYRDDGVVGYAVCLNFFVKDPVKLENAIGLKSFDIEDLIIQLAKEKIKEW